MKKIPFIAGLLIPLILFISLNWIEKPAALFKGMNFGQNFTRVSVGYNAKRVKAAAAFFGTSRSMKFQESLYKKTDTMPGINMSVPAASIVEEAYYFEHTENVRPLSKALVELNYYYFHDKVRADFSKDRLLLADTRGNPVKHLIYSSSFVIDVYNSLFSMGTFMMRIQENHSFNALTGLLSSTYDGIKKFRQVKSEATDENLDYQTAMDSFKRIIAIAKENKTELKFYIPPITTPFENRFYAADWSALEAWKKELLAEIEKQKTDKNISIELWDFSGFNSVTMSPLDPETKTNQWFGNADHFNQETGKIIFDKIYGTCAGQCGAPADFGTRLTPENVDSFLQANRKGFIEYLQKNKETADQKAAAIEKIAE